MKMRRLPGPMQVLGNLGMWDLPSGRTLNTQLELHAGIDLDQFPSVRILQGSRDSFVPQSGLSVTCSQD